MSHSEMRENSEIIKAWKDNYNTAPRQLRRMREVDGLISAFNANIDAVIKMDGKRIEQIVKANSLDEDLIISSKERKITSIEDVVRGVFNCFRSGIAEEWLVEDESVYEWLNTEIGYDKLQMGGQGGIVANAMAICGVNPVYVHCASIPSVQAGLFLDRANLLTVDGEGRIVRAASTDRKDDIPLIHWIIEFDRGDTLTMGGMTYECPKSNRFIATYDPLNFRLHIDPRFSAAMEGLKKKPGIIILSGYQMLREKLADGTPGRKRIDESISVVNRWRSAGGDQIIHLEMASTQDKIMRKYLLDELAHQVDSLGFNERELIDLLEVIGEDSLVEECNRMTDSVNMFKGMLRLLEYTRVPRLQLHMFGLYLTIQEKGFQVSPGESRDGMQLAAVIAAAKAGTGAINDEETLLWASGRDVSAQGIMELKRLSEYFEEQFGNNDLLTTGIWLGNAFDVIAVPTILIEKPVTLVGMGDTISSISLVAAR